MPGIKDRARSADLNRLQKANFHWPPSALTPLFMGPSEASLSAFNTARATPPPAGRHHGSANRLTARHHAYRLNLIIERVNVKTVLGIWMIRLFYRAGTKSKRHGGLGFVPRQDRHLSLGLLLDDNHPLLKSRCEGRLPGAFGVCTEEPN